MAEIFFVTYLVLGLLAAVLFWTVLMLSKRLENNQKIRSESKGPDRLLAPKTEPINFRPS